MRATHLAAALAALSTVYAAPEPVMDPPTPAAEDAPPAAPAEPDASEIPWHEGDPGPPVPDAGPNYPPSVKRKFTRYVALGDSYSAGPGATTNRQKDRPGPASAYPEECRQTDGGWPAQVFRDLMKDQEFQFSACTGWDTKQIRENQIEHVDSQFGDPDLISLTMGGNNNGMFLNVIMNCNFSWKRSDCEKALADAEDAVAEDSDKGKELSKEFTLTIDAAMTQKKSKWRTMTVMGYPELYNDQLSIVGDCAMNTDQRKRVNGLVHSLNEKLARAASEAAIRYKTMSETKGGDILYVNPNAPDAGSDVKAPPDRSFEGHHFCERWNLAYFNGGGPRVHWRFWNDWNAAGLALNWGTGLFHPTNAGHRVMADAAEVQLASLPEKPEPALIGGGPPKGSK